MFPLNLPNALTLIRILLVPVLVVALTVETPGGSAIAAIVFAIAALTDGLDGYIARSRQSVTNFGKVMDPVADKLMIAAALISLVSLDRLAAWVAMVIIAREFAVSGLRIAAGQQGVVIPASSLGKLKTITQVVAVLGPDRRQRPRRRLGADARLPDGRDDGRLRCGLLPQLPPEARGVRAPARAGGADGLGVAPRGLLVGRIAVAGTPRRGLFPQRHGFKGLGQVLVENLSRNEPVTDGVDMGKPQRDLGSACPSASSDVFQNDHVLAVIRHVLVFQGRTLKGGGEVPYPFEQAVTTVKGASEDLGPYRDDLHVRCIKGRDLFRLKALPSGARAED